MNIPQLHYGIPESLFKNSQFHAKDFDGYYVLEDDNSVKIYLDPNLHGLKQALTILHEFLHHIATLTKLEIIDSFIDKI